MAISQSSLDTGQSLLVRSPPPPQPHELPHRVLAVRVNPGLPFTGMLSRILARRVRDEVVRAVGMWAPLLRY